MVAPNINALGHEGTFIKEAYSHVGYTSPSLKTLFTGSLNPTPASPSLFRELKASGYQIAVFTGQPASFGNTSEIVGMEKSSDIFIDAEILKEERAFSFGAQGSLLVDGQILLREFDKFLGDKSKWEDPRFVYLNFQSAHFPYYHPGMKTSKILSNGPIPRSDISKDTEKHLRETYWNAVHYADWLIGQVIEKLKKLEVYDNTVLLITADHGESLFDDNFLGHGHFINRQQTHIPLVVNIPNITTNTPIGLSGYYNFITKLLGASNIPQQSISSQKHYVFQYTGNINRPSSIGIVENNKKFTVLNMETLDVHFSELNKVIYYKNIKSPSLKKRADQLIKEWEKQRWLSHLSALKE